MEGNINNPAYDLLITDNDKLRAQNADLKRKLEITLGLAQEANFYEQEYKTWESNAKDYEKEVKSLKAKLEIAVEAMETVIRNTSVLMPNSGHGTYSEINHINKVTKTALEQIGGAGE